MGKLRGTLTFAVALIAMTAASPAVAQTKGCGLTGEVKKRTSELTIVREPSGAGSFTYAACTRATELTTYLPGERIRLWASGAYALTLEKGYEFRALTLTDAPFGERIEVTRSDPERVEIQTATVDREGRVAWVELRAATDILMVRSPAGKTRVLARSAHFPIRKLWFSNGRLHWRLGDGRRSARVTGTSCRLRPGFRLVGSKRGMKVATANNRDGLVVAYACRRGDGRWRFLTTLSSFAGNRDETTLLSITNVKVDGRKLSLASTLDGSRYGLIDVFDMAQGRLDSYGSVLASSLVLGANRRAAYVGNGPSYDVPVGEVLVVVNSSRERTVVANEPAGAIQNVRLTSKTVTWTAGGAVRSFAF